MFLFSAATFLAELEAHNPEILALCRATLENRQTDMDFMRLDRESFTQINGISIDYAVMEHTDKAAVVPAEMGWSDVGAWGAYGISLWMRTAMCLQQRSHRKCFKFLYSDG